MPLPRIRNDRVPIWPDDLVGSITHTDLCAAAAVARRDQGFVAIGIDLEPADALPPELWARSPDWLARYGMARCRASRPVPRRRWCTMHLFGRSPEGAAIPKPLSSKMGRYMQTLAWQFVTTYGQRANSAARRDMAACRSLKQNDVCPAYVASEGTGILAVLKRRFDTNSCRRDYTDARDPDNSFASPRNEKRCRTRV